MSKNWSIWSNYEKHPTLEEIEDDIPFAQFERGSFA